MQQPKIDTLDKKIISIIANNARIPFLEVARMCKVSGAAIHQRIHRMMDAGIISGARILFNPEKIGYNSTAYIMIYLKSPEDFDRAKAALEKIPEVVECHYTTGGFDMMIKVFAKSNHDLLDLIREKIQPIGLARTETYVCFQTVIDRAPEPVQTRENLPSRNLRSRKAETE